MHQILIVDEEEHLLWALEKNLLPDRDDIHVITANSGEVGLDLLRDENIDVLICDIKMPGRVDGFQLILRAKEVAPDARVVIMTAFGTNRIQNLAERIGITHYIEKPFNISELRNVVLELLDAKEGFQGVLSDLELTDIIQMLCLAKRTALLHLKHKEHRGKIVFDRGDVTHAEFDEVEGEPAVYQMLALKQGDIYMQSDFQNEKRTINMGWQDLLLEGVRRADEHRAALGLEESSVPAVADSPSNPGTDPFTGVFEDSGEITLGMPPRLVSEVEEEEGAGEGLADDSSIPFFTEEELEEIENAAREDDLTGTANGFDRILDSGVRDLIDKHNNNSEVGVERTESEPFAHLADDDSSEVEEQISSPGRPTDSSDYPAQQRWDRAPSNPDIGPPVHANSAESMANSGQHQAVTGQQPAVTGQQPAASGQNPSSVSTPHQAVSAADAQASPAGTHPGMRNTSQQHSVSGEFPPAAEQTPPPAEPNVVAEEVSGVTDTGPRTDMGRPGAQSSEAVEDAFQPGAPPSSASANVEAPTPAQHTGGSGQRSTAPTMMLESPKMLDSRSVLEGFAKECQGLLITGYFSFDDGLALDFVSTPNTQYEEDTLSAFYRDVAASAQKTAGAFDEGGFTELQVAFEDEIILLRRIPQTPYIHIAVLETDARLGIALVLMRRTGERLSQCFTQ